MTPISRRSFLQGLAALTVAASLPKLPKWIEFASQEFRHQEEYDIRYMAWTQTWDRFVQTADGKYHQWYYMVMLDRPWMEQPQEVVEFHHQQRDYFWDKAVLRMQGQNPDWMVPLG